jgi:hypothetical protein
MLNARVKTKTKVIINKFIIFVIHSVILNVHGNAMIHIAQQYVIQFVNLQNAIHHALNPKTQFAMSNVKNLNVKLNVRIKDAKQQIAQNVLLYVNNHIV